MAQRIRLRRGTTTQWETADTVLAAGEPGVDLTVGEIRIGDGTTPWSGLEPVAGGGGGSVPAASTTTAGKVELATEVEAADGVDTARAVTPAGVAAALAALVDAAPGALDTLNELAAALGDDPNFATTITNALAGKATAAQGTTADAALPRAAAGASVEDIGAVEWRVNTVAAAGATETLDTSLYGTHDITMDQNCTFTFSNPAPSGKETEFKLILRGAFTPTFPAAVDWADATAPTYTTPSVYVFWTVDAGTTWFGAQAGKAWG